MRERLGRVIGVRAEASRVSLVTIAAEDPPELLVKAGQFLSLKLPDGSRRSYSIVSRSGRATHVELLVKASKPGGGTASMMRLIEVGEALSFFGPMGYFLYEHDHRDEVVFGATGVGITAILPMIEEALAAPRGPSRIELVWGLRDPDDLVLHDRLTALAVDDRLHHKIVFSGRGEGHITPHVIALAAELDDPRFYLCGHAAMINDISVGLPAAAAIHTEVFFPAPALPVPTGDHGAADDIEKGSP